MIHTDVIIVGKGISGLVLSILLKKQGINHVLLDRIESKKTMPLPETIPPSALALLESLNLLELFEKSSSKTFGYHALWGTASVTDNHFFNHNPYKYGLKLNKQALLNDLEEIVKDKIVTFNNLTKLNRSDTNVNIELAFNNDIQQINGRVMIDATGRNRSVLKHLGIANESYDNQIALSCHLPYIKHPKLVHSVFTESFENGWGIVSTLDEQTNCMTLYTQKGSPILPQLKDYKSWKTVLSNTQLLKDFLGPNENRKIVGGNANSSKASKISGSNWLAIGDAAISFDPISSHGISNAVYCAYAASKAITAHLKDHSPTHFNNYAYTLHQVFHEYLKQREKLYMMTQQKEPLP